MPRFTYDINGNKIRHKPRRVKCTDKEGEYLLEMLLEIKPDSTVKDYSVKVTEIKYLIPFFNKINRS